MSADHRETCVVVETDGAVANLHFNRPDALNAFDVTMAEAFADAVDTLLMNEAIRVIVIGGNGRGFSAGGDVAAFRNAGSEALELSRALIEPIHRALTRLHHSSSIVVARLHGPVVGAGMSVALSADLAIAADNTRFNMGYIKVGNSPDCGGSWYLARLLGMRKAMELTLLSYDIEASEALALGLVNRVVPLDDLESATLSMVSRLAHFAPLAASSIKALIRAASLNTLETQLDLEAGHFIRNSASEDFREALDAFFERRKANFIGK